MSIERRITNVLTPKSSLLVLICLGSLHRLQGTTLVYNLRIRRVFSGLSAFVNLDKKPRWAFSSVPIFYRRTGRFISKRFETDVCDKHIGGGSIFNLRYVPSRSWWFEATTAVQKESLKIRGTSNFDATRTAFDDVVLAGGYNRFISKNTQTSVYGLVGFPTKKNVTLEEGQGRLVGTRFYGLGGGAEISYSFINTRKTLVAGIIQGRIVHFFTRRWEPILAPGGKIQPGQASDILFSIRYRHKYTVFETGYNPTIFTNQAILLPTETITTQTDIRQGTYISVIHLFKKSRLTGRPLALGAGFLFNRLDRLDLNSVSAYINITLVF